MNKIYQVIWNATHFCWQAVSEIAKGGTVVESSIKRNKLNKPLLEVSTKTTVFAVNLLSASIALAGPTGGVVSSGTATISTAGTTTTINQSTAKAAIDWSSFSTNNNEVVNFVQPSSSSITLNRVTGSSASNLNGQLNANGQVFIINPNGVLFGSTSQVNTAGLVASTLNLSNSDFNNNLFNFNNTGNNKSIENRGKITVPTGGTVALLAPTVKHTGTIKASQGNVLLAAAGDITLNLNNGSLLGYTINQGKAQALINSGGMIQADGGKVVLTAKGIDELSNAVVNSVGVIQAQTVNNVRGVIELGSDLTSGTLNIGGTLDASAPNGGSGGQIKTSAANVQIISGTNITTQRNSTTGLPPTTSGWELQAKNIDVEFFGGSVSSTTLGDALNKGNVTLNAVGTAAGQGNINLNDATSWNANTALTLTASKDINFNSDLDLSGDQAKLAMNYGASSDYNLNNGAKINISGSSSNLVINDKSYIVINELGVEGDTSSNTLQGMQNNLTGNYALGSNIDASATADWNNGEGFYAVGQLRVGDVYQYLQGEGISSAVPIFQGNFHGLGHQIDSLTIHKPNGVSQIEALPQGLFGITYGSELRDIGLTNISLDGFAYVGALSGLHFDGNVKNTYSTGRVDGLLFTGGLIGQAGDPYFGNNQGKISHSYSDTQVTSFMGVGGLVGMSLLPIYDSYATGNIAFADLSRLAEQWDKDNTGVTFGAYAGGLAGQAVGIYNSYATGDILSGAYINGNWHPEFAFIGAGGLAGVLTYSPRQNENYYIDHSYATGNISGLSALGGLVGQVVGNSQISRLYVNNSYSTGNVIGNSVVQSQYVGGLVGYNTPNSIIQESFSTGLVKGDLVVGGLVGRNDGTVTNSYSTSWVDGNSSVGGLIGSNAGTIEYSYSNGAVTGVNNIGGLIGENSSSLGTVNESYWNTETSGQSNSAGGIGKTTAELQQILTFSGWDIADVSDPNSTSMWVIDEDQKAPWLRYNH
ncbi:filamentous hemagglutinin N-terminal domain-containing protein [Acinetobacter sp. IK40]|uniref:two-partner secretion domain-containing protein n=1 Tax=Acinetobacter sp. IK40 TaxID=2928897 RepID=UPI002D1ED2EC|nr:filamentous hemagglutinin N-terminal domain-containing protein [Acinetobacter sp. IK40]MEB3792887.1 filamentous hemagglutinin N-terminal domain-containing protein [Acinetobacter sp. IK40]